MRAGLLIVSVLIALPLLTQVAAPARAVSGGQYYVDGKHGSDANTGTTLNNAFKTIAAASGALKKKSSAAGWKVSVVGYSDYVYRERPIPPGWDASGTSSAPIVFEAVGYNGSRYGYTLPIVSGGDTAPAPGKSWSVYSTGVWKTAWATEPFDFGQLSGSLKTAVFEDVTGWLWERTSVSDLKAHAADGTGGYWWSGGYLYVAPLNHANPSDHSFDVVMRNTFYFYGVYGVHDVTVRGFEVRHSANGISFAKGVDNGTATDNRLIGNLLMGISVSGLQTSSGPDPATGAVIERNEGAYNTFQAVKIDEGTVDATVCDNDFHDNALQGIKVQGPPGGSSYTGVSSGNVICRNLLHGQNYNPTGSAYNNASGVSVANGARSTTVSDNEIWGNDVGIHVTQESAGLPAITGTQLDGNWVWSNRRFALYLFDGNLGSGSGVLTASHELYWGNGMGVMADRGTSNKTLDHVTIWDNDSDGVHVGVVNKTAAHLTITNSLVTNNGQDGIWLVTGSTASLSHTAMSGNAVHDIYAAGGGLTSTAVNNKPASYLSTAASAPGFLTIGPASYQFTAGPSGAPIGALWATEFVDIAGSSFYADILWLASSGITSGCAPNFFCPDDPVTRGQMAAFLDRALHLPATTTDYFTDDNGTTFEGNINRLAASGITAGCTATTFCPTADVTRGQMAAFLDRALHLPATTTDYFTDDNGTTFEASINRLAASGITKGCTATTFCPTADVTRGQMAAFLHRAFGP